MVGMCSIERLPKTIILEKIKYDEYRHYAGLGSEANRRNPKG
jgi:hypothetical protein